MMNGLLKLGIFNIKMRFFVDLKRKGKGEDKDKDKDKESIFTLFSTLHLFYLIAALCVFWLSYLA